MKSRKKSDLWSVSTTSNRIVTISRYRNVSTFSLTRAYIDTISDTFPYYYQICDNTLSGYNIIDLEKNHAFFYQTMPA